MLTTDLSREKIAMTKKCYSQARLTHYMYTKQLLRHSQTNIGKFVNQPHTEQKLFDDKFTFFQSIKIGYLT